MAIEEEIVRWAKKGRRGSEASLIELPLGMEGGGLWTKRR